MLYYYIVANKPKVLCLLVYLKCMFMLKMYCLDCKTWQDNKIKIIDAFMVAAYEAYCAR